MKKYNSSSLPSITSKISRKVYFDQQKCKMTKFFQYFNQNLFHLSKVYDDHWRKQFFIYYTLKLKQKDINKNQLDFDFNLSCVTFSWIYNCMHSPCARICITIPNECSSGTSSFSSQATIEVSYTEFRQNIASTFLSEMTICILFRLQTSRTEDKEDYSQILCDYLYIPIKTHFSSYQTNFQWKNTQFSLPITK